MIQGILPDELIVDSFAGGGGASCGVEMATGRSPDIAVNHNEFALAMHKANHPYTNHYNESVWDVKPKKVTQGRPVGLAWFSPDCRHFSKAKGGKPVEKKVRGLAWVACWWAHSVKPRIIIVENVEEFQTWGPLGEDGKPCPARKGFTFYRWVKRLRDLGYKVEWRELKADNYGAPTIRKRLFVVARRDGMPIVWPKPTHGPGLKPYRTAADILDFSAPILSIFANKDQARVFAGEYKTGAPKRPLAESTMKRIARGILKHTIQNKEPFIIGVTQTGGGASGSVRSANAPLSTIVTKAEQCLVTAFLAKHYTGVIGNDLREPVGTVTTIDHHSLVSSQLVHFRGSVKHGDTSSSVNKPVRTITAKGNHISEVRAFLTKYYGQGEGQNLTEPLHTITTKDRFGLVMIQNVAYQIVDIFMRMLSPRELFLAQGFPPTYKIDIKHKGKWFTKKKQVHMCGNSVSPVVACALIKANIFISENAGPESYEWEPGLVKPVQLSLFDFHEVLAEAA